MAVLATIGLVVFLARELTTDTPFVDLRVLRNYNFSLGLALMFFSGVTLYGLTTIIPLFLQSLLGYTSLWSGYVMVPRGLAALVAMPLAGRLVGKIQGRYLVAGGFLLFGAASILLGQITLDISPWVLFWPLFISGFAIAFQFVPLNTLALGSLKQEEIGNASGIFNLMRNVGGSVGISLVTTLAQRSAQAHQTILAAHTTPYDTAYQSTLQALGPALGAQGGAIAGQQQALGSMYQTLLTQANFLAYLDNFHLFALLCFACVAGGLLLKNVTVKGPVSVH